MKGRVGRGHGIKGLSVKEEIDQKNKSREERVQIDWCLLLPPLAQCLGPVGTQL